MSNLVVGIAVGVIIAPVVNAVLKGLGGIATRILGALASE